MIWSLVTEEPPADFPRAGDVYEIELQNEKAGDIPIIVIKAARIVISPYLSKLYNIGIASGIFPDVLKTRKNNANI